MDLLKEAITKSVALAHSKGQILDERLVIKRLISSLRWTRKEVIAKWRELGMDYRVLNKGQNRAKLDKARNVAKILEQCRWIKMVAVTGSVAMENASKDDDIDILVITQNKRLWLARIWVLISLLINGVDFRRNNKPQRADQFCFNMWLEERSLEVTDNKRTLGAALDAINMKVVGGNRGYHVLFLRKNRWIGKYLKTAWEEMTQKPISAKTKRNGSRAGDWLNIIVFGIQYLYMKSKITKETISLEAAYFHPRKI